MKIETKKLQDGMVEIKCEMSWQEFEPHQEKALERLGKDARIKGFRQGKAPKDIIESHIGQDKIMTEAAEIAVKEKYVKIVEEEGLEVIGPPNISITKLAPNNPFSFKVAVSVLPDVGLPDYKEIAKGVKKEQVKIEEKEIENALEWFRKSKAKFEDLGRGAQKGDFITIEYSSPLVEDNKKFEDSFILGEGRLAPGFEDKLIGIKQGEKKEFSLEIPESYFKKELAGKKADFQIKAAKVQKMILPELNDELAKTVGRFEDLASLKEDVEKGTLREKQKGADEKWKADVLGKIIKKAEFEMPEILIQSEKARILEKLKKDINSQLKISFKEYLKQNQKTEQALDNDLVKQAKEQVSGYLVLRQIGKDQNIQISEDEILKETQKFLMSYPQDQKDKIDINQLKEYYRNKLFNDKIFAVLENF